MATVYSLSKKVKFNGAAERLFAQVLAKLPREKYPNGVSGWKDKQKGVFEALGFRVKSEHAGLPRVAAEVIFDKHDGVTPAQVKRILSSLDNV